jgi:hypothetical protein
MNKAFAATAITLVAAALLPATAGAQSSENWQFGASIYLYLPTISGKTTFPQGAGSDVAVDADKILDSLSGAFMGNFEARKGRWGGFTDVIYVDLSQSKSGFRDMTVGGNQLPAGVSGNADFSLRGTAWTLAGSYRLVPDQRAPVDVFVGTRMLDVREKLTWQLSGNVSSIPTPGRAGTNEAKLQNWDFIVGAKGRWAFGNERKWFVPYYFDVGTGDSDSTFQAVAGIGYSFGWGDVVGSWRYLDYKLKSGGKIESLNFNGPALAAVFHW